MAILAVPHNLLFGSRCNHFWPVSVTLLLRLHLTYLPTASFVHVLDMRHVCSSLGPLHISAAQVCKPNGYFTVVDFEHMTDIWAFCVLRMVQRHNNSGDPDNILYDHPMGWWDADWPGSHHVEGCFTNDAVVNDTYFLVILFSVSPKY